MRMHNNTGKQIGARTCQLRKMTNLLLVLAFSGLSASCTPHSGTQTAPLTAPPSQLITNVMIVDGTGAPGYTGNVRITDKKIVAVGDVTPTDNDQVTDGNGLVLTPGFIDTHSHHDLGLEQSPEAIAAISQGITTIVVGNDGNSQSTMTQLKEQLTQHPPTVNVASYTGHGSVRSVVMGADYKRNATAAEVTQMRALLKEELNNGSLGLSTGLEYDPGIYSNKDEVITLAKVIAAEGGRYISHMRSEDRAFDDALEELLEIGRVANIPVQISHIKLASTDLWGQASRVLQRLDQARKEGIDVTADIYPYTFWQSTLTVLLPNRDYYDLDAARYALEKLAPADGLTLVNYTPDPSLVGKTVADIALERGMSNEETYLQLIRDVYEDKTSNPLEKKELKKASEAVMGESMSEDDIATLLAWPHTNLCSDGYGEGHPRGRGAFPRAIRQYVREQGILSIEQMIHKMTGLAATHMGFSDRGLIKNGYTADLVLFDPATITDKATIMKPKQLSEGIVGVWVNGDRVWRDRGVTNARPGTLITRSRTK